MDATDELAEGLKKLVGDRMSAVIWPGKVISVNESEGTCDVEDTEGVEVFDIRLRATIDGSEKGVLIYPKVGSYVLCGDIGNSETEYCVVQFSEVDKVYIEGNECKIVSGQVTVDVDSTGVEISKGSISLKSVLDSLLTQIKLITVTCASPGSPSTPPINVAAFESIGTQLGQVLK